MIQCGSNVLSVDQTMQRDHSMESYWTVLSCCTVCFVIQCASNFLVCGSNHEVWPFFGKLRNSTFMWCCLVRDITFQSVDQTMQCGLSFACSKLNSSVARRTSLQFCNWSKQDNNGVMIPVILTWFAWIVSSSPSWPLKSYKQRNIMSPGEMIYE